MKKTTENKGAQEQPIVEKYKQGMFIEVQGQIRKKSLVPTPDGGFEERYIDWSIETIRRRYGNDMTKHIIDEMPNYDGEVIMPQHINYQPVIGRYLNAYKPLKYTPMAGANWNHIEQLIRHIFEEHYELGLDYLQLLYLKPMQKLPVLLLVSEETGTGKSTFCNFLRLIFGDNATEVTNDNLRSQFTSTWLSKLIIYIEETLLDRREDSEKIKNLVTAATAQSEAKGKDRVEVPLFAKFVMCSNDEERPVTLSPQDTRFWVRKIRPLPKNGRNTSNFLQEVEKEIPYFLHFLAERELSTKCEDRLWFRRDLIETDAWRKIVHNSRSACERQMVELLLDVMKTVEIQELKYSIKDLVTLMRYEDYKVNREVIKKILAKWHLVSEKCRYTRYMQGAESNAFIGNSTTGWAFTFTFGFLHSLTD